MRRFAVSVMFSAVLGANSAVLGANAVPAVATVGNAPRSTLASVIPSTAIPRSQVTFAVYCSSARATSATLLGRPLGLTEHIPMRPNTAAGDFTASVILPGSIQPGTYHPSIKCSDGTSATARLLVPAFGAAGSASDRIGAWLTAAALIVLGFGAVTGSIVLRRRNRRDSGDSDDSGSTGSSGPPDRVSDHADRSRQSDHSGVGF